MSVRDQIRAHLTQHPDTWFSSGQIVRELSTPITSGRALTILKDLVAAGVADVAPTGFTRYTRPKTKYRLKRREGGAP